MQNDDRRKVSQSSLREQDPAVLFDAGRVLSDDGPHGLVVRAAVADSVRDRIGSASVAVKILAIGDRWVVALRDSVQELVSLSSHASLVIYHGVWPVPGDPGEVWFVSELCESGSIPDILMAANITDPAKVEAIASYVMRIVLLAVDFLHSNDHVHGDIRANNFLVDGRGHIKVGDYGVYHILEAAMKNRMSYPGARLWPAPELGAGVPYDAVAEVWAVGISLLEIVEGRRFVRSAHRKATTITDGPRLPDSSSWSPQLREFLSLACHVDRKMRATVDELLQTDFIQLGTMAALDQAVNAASLMPTPAELQALYNPNDVVQRLCRQNNFIRAPLIDLDSIAVEDFFGVDRHVHDDESTPAVELGLRIALDNMGKRAEFHPRMSVSELLVRTFVETIDIARSAS